MRFIARHRLCMTHIMILDIALACTVLAKVLRLLYQVKIFNYRVILTYYISCYTFLHFIFYSISSL